MKAEGRRQKEEAQPSKVRREWHIILVPSGVFCVRPVEQEALTDSEMDRLRLVLPKGERAEKVRVVEVVS